MSVTLSLYNHTAKRFAEGSNGPSDTYKLKLLTAATFNPADTTLTATGGTETAEANGYTAGGQALTSVAITTVNTNDAAFDAADVTWSATTGSIEASFAILYNDTDTNDPPVAFLDFGGVQQASAGTDFRVIWNAGGILTFTVA